MMSSTEGRMEMETYLTKQDIYWECSSWNVEYGHVAKKRCKLVRVHSSRGDDELQISSSRYNLMGDSQEKTDGYTQQMQCCV